MPFNHEVTQGEHLSSIAAQYGFPDYTKVWNHPGNAELKELRKNPNVLFDGDVLFIPDKEQKQESGATTQRHTYEISMSQLMLNLVLEDSYEKPIAGAPVYLTLGEKVCNMTSDANGKVQQVIPMDVQQCNLLIKSDATAYSDEFFNVMVGYLDPIDTLSGQSARLNNLGYFAGTPNDANDPDFQSAVQEFQCDHNLTVDGDPGPVTQSKLKQVHGC